MNHAFPTRRSSELAHLDHAGGPREHREAEARVVAAAVVVMIALARRGPALIAFLDPPDRAVEQLVGEPLARDPHRRRPAEPKGGPLRFVADLIGGAGRHPPPCGRALSPSCVIGTCSFCASVFSFL